MSEVSTARKLVFPISRGRPKLLTTSSIYQGKEGIISVKTKQAILVAHYPDTIQPGEAAKTVEQLADYLLSVGY